MSIAVPVDGLFKGDLSRKQMLAIQERIKQWIPTGAPILPGDCLAQLVLTGLALTFITPSLPAVHPWQQRVT